MFISYQRGMAQTLLPLLAIIAGVVVAGIFYGSMAEVLSGWFHSPMMVNIVAFVLVFALFMMAGLFMLSMARQLLGRSISLAKFGWGSLTHTILPLAAIILGIALAGIFYGSLADLLSNWIGSRSQATILAFLIIAVVVIAGSIELFVILSSIAGNRTVKLPFAGLVDRLGGLVLGFAIGAILAGTLLSLITKYPTRGLDATVGDSALAGFFLDQFPLVLALLPGEFDAVRQIFG
jgi:uncharacterized membrane protein required for colicin V production